LAATFSPTFNQAPFGSDFLRELGVGQYGDTAMNRIGSVLALLLVVILAACSQPETVTPASPWLSDDIGSVAVKGSVTVLGGSADLGGSHDLEIEAAGTDLSGTHDSFHFGHVAHEGDAVISARIDDIEETDRAAKAGVMIRANLDADSAHAFMSIRPDGSAEFIWRNASGVEASVRSHDVASPAWVRLIRTGSAISGAVSANGTDWEDVHSVEIQLGNEVHVGVAATSNMDQLGRTAVRELELRDGETMPPADMDTPGEPGPPVTGTPPPADVDEPAPQVPPSGTPPHDWVCPSAPLSPRFQPTMYVATTGSDSNDGRSIDRPLRTLGKATSLVRAGDVVWVRGGVYSSNVEFRTSGTAGNPIVFESYPGECAILDGSGESQRVRFSNVRHVTMRNFVVRNSPQEGVFMQNSHENTVSNIISHNNAINGFLTMGGNNNLITRFIAYDNYSASRAGDADGISISTGDGNRIIDCIAFNNSDDGVDTWLSTNSVIENCVSFNNGYHNGQVVGDGNGFKAGGRSNNANTIIRNSIAFNNRANGFDFNSGRNVTFDNNTSFANGRHGFNISGGTVRNNIAFQNANSALGGSGNSSVTNSWDLGINQPGFLSTNPDSADFLQLSASSPAVGAGTDLGQPYSGRAPDLGALPAGTSIMTLLGMHLQGAGQY
jgi:regulation of enolase protein 1 (concanavalin A-like superfamily)